MAISWYQCKKCEALIKKDSNPNINGCPKGSSHDWKKLAEVGAVNYQCKRCGALIQAKSNPNINGCPGGSSHDWKKL